MTSRDYGHMTFDLTQPTICNPAFVAMFFAAGGGRACGIEDGATYFNIDTVTNPGGEIRSELIAVPGPIVGAGLPGIFAGVACSAGGVSDDV